MSACAIGIGAVGLLCFTLLPNVEAEDVPEFGDDFLCNGVCSRWVDLLADGCVLETGVFVGDAPAEACLDEATTADLPPLPVDFRVLLSVLTALGGFGALLLLVIPPGRHHAPYPSNLEWGISCGRPNNRARFQKLMLHGFKR